MWQKQQLEKLFGCRDRIGFGHGVDFFGVIEIRNLARVRAGFSVENRAFEGGFGKNFGF